MERRRLAGLQLALHVLCVTVLATAGARGGYLEEDISALRELMTDVQEKVAAMQRQQGQKLDSQLSLMGSRLDHIEQSMRSLHERSAAWDAMAQGVRRSEELLKLMEGRIEGVSRRQETLLGADGASGTVSRKQMLEVIAARVNSLDAKAANIIKRLSDDSLLGLRRYESLVERLIRMEGHVSLLQDGQRKVRDAVQDLCPRPPHSPTSTPRGAIAAASNTDGGGEECDGRLATKVLAELLEILSGESDDGANVAEGPHEVRRSTRSRQPEVLFRKVWRKFQNPVAKINKRLEALEQLAVQTNFLCNDSYAVTTKIQHALARGECSQIGYELRRFTIRTDEQLSQLEQKVGRQMTRLTKMLDRATQDGATTSHTYPATCEQVQERGYTSSGVYTIQPSYGERFEAFCDLTTQGGAWTVIQRRGDFGFKRENFNRDWEGYRNGFGDPRRDFWIGNERLHDLTTREDVVLRIELEDWDGNRTYAEYLTFRVGSEEEKFVLQLANYTGNASDSLSAHNGKAFSTYDQIHDEAPPCCPCARTYLGGWWFYSCFEAHLNGPYHANPTDNDYFQGIIWEHWRGDYSLHATAMKIRPKELHYKFTGRGGLPPEDP